LPALDWRDEKAAWVTALGNAGAAVKLTAPALAELPGWIANRLRRQEQTAGQGSAGFHCRAC
jgi:DNA polymerase-3 subunit delta